VLSEDSDAVFIDLLNRDYILLLLADFTGQIEEVTDEELAKLALKSYHAEIDQFVVNTLHGVV
jgi:hypothetical protein